VSSPPNFNSLFHFAKAFGGDGITFEESKMKNGKSSCVIS
jgi:hypothetical protein